MNFQYVTVFFNNLYACSKHRIKLSFNSCILDMSMVSVEEITSPDIIIFHLGMMRNRFLSWISELVVPFKLQLQINSHYLFSLLNLASSLRTRILLTPQSRCNQPNSSIFVQEVSLYNFMAKNIKLSRSV